jgi:hypothetical protein
LIISAFSLKDLQRSTNCVVPGDQNAGWFCSNSTFVLWLCVNNGYGVACLNTMCSGNNILIQNTTTSTTLRESLSSTSSIPVETQSVSTNTSSTQLSVGAIVGIVAGVLTGVSSFIGIIIGIIRQKGQDSINGRR